MIDSSALLADLKTQLKALQVDLRKRAEDRSNAWGARLRAEHGEAVRRERTGHSWVDWRDNEVDQAAVAWLVATTFLRFCEDNDLLAGARLDAMPTAVGWIAGPGNRTQRAEENLTAYFRTNPTHNRRHWLQHGFRVLAAQPAGAALVDPQHNPVWTAEISPETANALISFWRRTDAGGALVHDFTDPELDTRFLGDLYQDLSEHAKKTYALLQTPVFVEEFILDQTLTPAIAEFGLNDLKLIDPTCGSGHFLLGAFERLNQAWLEEAPALDAKVRVRRAMASIHGVDLNPFAVAIARFRLTVAALKATGERSLVGVPAMGFHLAIGDSLLGEQGGVPETLNVFDEGEERKTFLYDSEDLSQYLGILKPSQYHVVVGNPPYITVKDKALNTLYRKSYKTAVSKYALSVPFMELFFRLAIRGEQGRGAGYVGQITANSFMKREFGKSLIEDLFGGRHAGNPVDLTAVIDTSGAYIPGHGTPTVILIGRRRRPVSDTVRAVMGVSGGPPGQPDDPAKGVVWTEILEHLDDPGYDGKYVSVVDLSRTVLVSHPWSLGGGGASELKDALESARQRSLGDCAESLGITSFTLATDVYVRSSRAIRRLGVNEQRPMVIGEQVRDWGSEGDDHVLFPYDLELRPSDVQPGTALYRAMWPHKTVLANSQVFGRQSKVEAGLKWTEFGRLTISKFRTPLSVLWSHIATHNHFALDRGGRVFNQHAPVIKLPEGTSEEEHLELLGLLNSSTACFWLKQVSHNKGSTVDAKGARQTQAPWEDFYEFIGTRLEQFPLPAKLPLEGGRIVDALARQLEESSPRAIIEACLEHSADDLGQRLQEGEARWGRLRERMIFEQEELDWDVYGLYGLCDDVEALVSAPAAERPGLTGEGQVALGQRAFEIALARRVAAGEEETAWFERHGSTPITELPPAWPADYRGLVQRRLDLMESNPSIQLLEKPEFKRRWATTPWADQLADALEAAILDRLEHPEFWRDEQGPTTRTVAELADLLRSDGALRQMATVLTGRAEPELAAVLGSLVAEQGVPFLAAHRYKASGLEKFRAWQEVWRLQRREDAGEKVTTPVPPTYKQADFRKTTYWKARGKLDVPKERFILYPGVGRAGDSTAVLGWAGWSHRDQALALAREIPAQQALGVDDAGVEPLVAGLVELEPWLEQWHSEIEPAYGTSPAAVISGVVDQYLARLEKTRDQVTAWEPPAPARGRAAQRMKEGMR